MLVSDLEIVSGLVVPGIIGKLICSNVYNTCVVVGY